MLNSHTSLATTALAILGALASSACAGVYVEGQASVYPSLKYSEDHAVQAPDKVRPNSGSAVALGANVGFDFDLGERSSRYSAGYVAQRASNSGAKISGGAMDTRLDLKLARLTATSRLRLGFGFDLGTQTTTMTKAATGASVSKTGNIWVFDGGPVYAQYFGRRHEVSVMGALSYLIASAPNGGITGAGFGAKLTYSFHFGDTRPGTYLHAPLNGAHDLMEIVDAAAKADGCKSQYIQVHGRTVNLDSGLTMTAVIAHCPADNEEIEYIQDADGVLITCPHLEDAACKALSDAVLSHIPEESKTEQPKTAEPKAAQPIAPPAPSTEPKAGEEPTPPNSALPPAQPE